MKRTIISMVLALLCVTGISAAKKVKNKEMVVFNHYGTEVQIHLDASKRVKVKKAADDEIIKCMTWIESATAQTLKDCQQQKQEARAAPLRLGLCEDGRPLVADRFG